VRIGGGNLKSLVVFFVLGVSAFITLKGAFALFRVGAIEPARDDAGHSIAGRRVVRPGASDNTFGDRCGACLALWRLDIAHA
jgi:hypothetical protein